MLRAVLTTAIVMAATYGALAQQEERYDNCRPIMQQRSDTGERSRDDFRMVCSNRPGDTQTRCYQRGDGSTFCEAD